MCLFVIHHVTCDVVYHLICDVVYHLICDVIYHVICDVIYHVICDVITSLIMWRPGVLDISSDDEMIGKKFGSGKRNDAQPADSDLTESEASDKDMSSG